MPVNGRNWFSVNLSIGTITTNRYEHREIDRMTQIVRRALASRPVESVQSNVNRVRKPEVGIIGQTASLGEHIVALGGVRESQKISAQPGVFPVLKLGEGGTATRGGLLQMPQNGNDFSFPRKVVVDAERIGIMTIHRQMAWYQNCLVGGGSNG